MKRFFPGFLFLMLLAIPAGAQNTNLSDKAVAFFDDSQVREIRLWPEDPNWYNLMVQNHQNQAQTGDPFIASRFKWGEIERPRIGIRFKGNSSFRRNGIKRPFKLDFNEFDTQADFLGLSKLNLQTNDLSPDFMREKLFSEFMGKFIPALRMVHVRLYVNDVYYGLYTAMEQPDKNMMESRYGKNEDGNLWEGNEVLAPGGAGRPDLTFRGLDPAPYRTIYELETNQIANDYSQLIEFIDVLNNTPTAELPAKFEPIADVEEILSYIALNHLFVNLDSYVNDAGEYYLYSRTRDGKFIAVAWDHNESFGTTGDGTPRINPPFAFDPFWLPANATTTNQRPLAQKLWAVPEYRRLYLRLLARFLREGFNTESFSPRITQLASQIREHVVADPNKVTTNAQFELNLNEQTTAPGAGGPGGALPVYGLNQFVRERYNFMRPWLNTQAQPVDVRLNEIVAVNNGSYKDNAGDSDPWVEIHNLGPGPVTLTNFYLTDDTASPAKWQLPAKTLADGEFLVIWLDGETAEGDTHASFRPQTSGGKLYLYSTTTANPAALDSVTYPGIGAGNAYIRLGYYGNTWTLTGAPTGGMENRLAAVNAPNMGTGQLLINEIMADNKSTFQDPDEPGSFEDWIEIYNPGNATVDMSGMYLTDNVTNPTKFRIPAGVTIPAKGYLVFIADDNETIQGPRHLSFSLNADGEGVALYQTDGVTLIDSISFGVQSE
ncbi:MAG: CotH kinase family protein, partial [Blastocatellia bacterium]